MYGFNDFETYFGRKALNSKKFNLKHEPMKFFAKSYVFKLSQPKKVRYIKLFAKLVNFTS